MSALEFVPAGELAVMLEVALAMVLGGVIDFERELEHKPAGFRTHMLVAAAAALLVGLNDLLLAQLIAMPDRPNVRADPMRIIEAVVTGISFLGAGTILHSFGQKPEPGQPRAAKPAIEGLTTAASLLFVAAIGITVALRLWWLAGAMTVLVLLVLRGLHIVERRLRLPGH